MAVEHDNAGDRVADVIFDAVRAGSVGVRDILDGDQLGRGEGDGHGVRFEEADQPAGYIGSNRSYREEWSSFLLTEPGAEEQ